MKKTLAERLAEKAQKQPECYSAGKATEITITKMRGDIQQALDTYWPVKSIWSLLKEEGTIDISYQYFSAILKKLGFHRKQLKDIQPARKEPIIVGNRPRGFDYDPRPDIDKLV